MAREVTYCLSYPLILTRACAQRCGYCRFPLVEPDRLPSLRVVRRHLREAARCGATQVELIAGEGIDNEPAVVERVRYFGFNTYQSYLTQILEMIEATDRRSHLFSQLNIGPLSLAELRIMRPYLCAMRLMLESADPILGFRRAHRDAPSKLPDERLEAILCCGKVGVPLTTGILVGVGESPSSRATALEIIGEAHERYGHVQAVRIQKFHPAAGTPMENAPGVSDEEFLEVVALADRMLGYRMAVQVSADEHPHLIGRLLDAGVTDFGDISLRARRNPEISLNALIGQLGVETQGRGWTLTRRFPIHEVFCSAHWYPGGFPHRIPHARNVLLERTSSR